MGKLRYVHSDHLGSVSPLTDESGKVMPGSEQRFLPFGKLRTRQPVLLPTGRNFTRQQLDVNTGLLSYGSSQGYGRYYDPALARFVQPDTLVPNPGDPQQLNRYSYAANNPVKYRDPSGHWFESPLDTLFIAYDLNQIRTEGLTPVNSLALAADVASLILPGITGGGPGVRLAFAGGEAALRAASHVPQELRAIQVGAKVLQFAQAGQLPLPGFEDLAPESSLPSGTKAERWGDGSITG